MIRFASIALPLDRNVQFTVACVLLAVHTHCCSFTSQLAKARPQRCPCTNASISNKVFLLCLHSPTSDKVRMFREMFASHLGVIMASCSAHTAQSRKPHPIASGRCGCETKRRLHDWRSCSLWIYRPGGYVVDHDRFVYKPHSCSVDNRL